MDNNASRNRRHHLNSNDPKGKEGRGAQGASPSFDRSWALFSSSCLMAVLILFALNLRDRIGDCQPVSILIFWNILQPFLQHGEGCLGLGSIRGQDRSSRGKLVLGQVLTEDLQQYG